MKKLLKWIIILFLVSSSVFAQKAEKSYRITGDWKDPGGKYFAQVYLTPEGIYQMNLTTDLTSRKVPEGILIGENAGEKAINFKGDTWTGKIENGKLEVNKENEKLVMEHFYRISPTMNAAPPQGAIVLFDGTNLDSWTKVLEKDWLVGGTPADNWKIVDGGFLEAFPHPAGSYESIISRKKFGDIKLHLEFRVLGQVTNGGVYLMSRYEINIKDTYGQVGGTPIGFGNIADPKDMYPEVNVAFPPMEWQTLDIDFRAPRFNASGTQKTEDARITVIHNGVVIYKDVALKAVKGSTAKLGEAGVGPIYLQEHGVAYQYRNIWVVDKTLKGTSKFSTLSGSQEKDNSGNGNSGGGNKGGGNKAGGKAVTGGKNNGNSDSGSKVTGRTVSGSTGAGKTGSLSKSENSINTKTVKIELPGNPPEKKKGSSQKNVYAGYVDELNPAYANEVLNLTANNSGKPAPSAGFVHPGVLMNQAQLNEIKKRVSEGVEPQKTAFEVLKASAFADINYTPKPIDTVCCGPHSTPNIGCKDEQSDCEAAYTQSLLWIITGNKAYAEKSIEIMNAWSYTFVGGHNYANGPVQAAWCGAVWPRAAEIMRYTYDEWSDADIVKFQNMLRLQYLPSIMHGDCENGNKELAMCEALVNIGVFLDDKDVFNLGIKMWRSRTPAYIYLKIDGPAPIEPPGCGTAIWGNKGMTPEFVDGLLQETARDSHHPWYAYASMTDAAETAHQQGVDLYGEQAERMMAALEFQAQYLPPNNTPAPENLTFALQPTWEIAFNHFHNRIGYDLPKMAVVIPTNRPTGVNHHMLWETLTHGGMGGIGIADISKN